MGKAVRLTMVICLALVFASCEISPSQDVLGKWKATDGAGTLEFTRAGMLNLTEGKMSSILPYRFLSPTRLEITLGPLGTVGWDVKLEKDTMTLTGAGGKAIQMKKVKDQAQKPGVAQKEQPQPKQEGQLQKEHPQPAKPQLQTKQPQQQPQGQQQHKS